METNSSTTPSSNTTGTDPTTATQDFLIVPAILFISCIVLICYVLMTIMRESASSGIKELYPTVRDVSAKSRKSHGWINPIQEHSYLLTISIGNWTNTFSAADLAITFADQNRNIISVVLLPFDLIQKVRPEIVRERYTDEFRKIKTELRILTVELVTYLALKPPPMTDATGQQPTRAGYEPTWIEMSHSGTGHITVYSVDIQYQPPETSVIHNWQRRDELPPTAQSLPPAPSHAWGYHYEVRARVGGSRKIKAKGLSLPDPTKSPQLLASFRRVSRIKGWHNITVNTTEILCFILFSITFSLFLSVHFPFQVKVEAPNEFSVNKAIGNAILDSLLVFILVDVIGGGLFLYFKVKILPHVKRDPRVSPSMFRFIRCFLFTFMMGIVLLLDWGLYTDLTEVSDKWLYTLGLTCGLFIVGGYAGYLFLDSYDILFRPTARTYSPKVHLGENINMQRPSGEFPLGK